MHENKSNPLEIKIEKLVLKYNSFKVHAFAFFPTKESTVEKKNAFAIFTHGYTSHKGDLINWGSRLAHFGISTLIFDLPGHYIGNFYELKSFELFKKETHYLFLKAYEYLSTHESISKQNSPKLILGGHSLGSYFALKALDLPKFKKLDKLAILVGFGISVNSKGVHLFNSAFYRKTMDMRKQLISKHLDPDHVFPWMDEEKQNLNVKNKKIYMLTGTNDAVVGPLGSEHLFEQLKNKGNDIELIKPGHLPHHEPEVAAPHIMGLIKKIF